MRSLIISLITLILLNIGLLHSQTWPKFYGETNRIDRSKDIIETYDKGYLILGGYQAFSWLIKTDINGNILWEKIIDNYPRELPTAQAIEATSDGGVLVCGIALSGFSNKRCPFVMKLNACGEKEWCKIFEGSPIDPSWAVDIKETVSGDIVVLVYQYGTLPEEAVHLFKLTADGDVLWKEPLATTYDHPGSAHKKGKRLIINNEGNYIISGLGYWRHPWNPGPGVWLRPMFIKADSMGNEMWVLPFGLNDTVVGKANHSLALQNNAFLGSGYNWHASNMIEPMHFVYDNTGNELGFSIHKPDNINSLLSQGSFETSQLTDIGVFSGGAFVNENGQIETILDCMLDFDTNTYILEPFNHKLNLNGRQPYLNTLSHDKKLLTIYTYYHSSTNSDISLAKLNLNLEYDTAYAGNFTYDSLCIPGPPQSGFIYLEHCDIITSIEMPSAAEYRERISHIPLTIYPNPATDRITFDLENTDHHRNIELRCFNLLGLQQHHVSIYSGQKQASANVSAWPPGMYIAVVYSHGKPVGREKFVVR